MSRHVVFDISGHGYGHFAQTAPVINALQKLKPDWKITLRTRLPANLVSHRIVGQYELLNHASDFGMAMNSALDVDRDKSLQHYVHAHASLTKTMQNEAKKLSQLKPDLLFSNISYVSIAAAKITGIPAIAMCSLNWADIFAGYCHGEEANRIYAQIVECYQQADRFLCPEPSMAMPEFNTKPIAALSALGTSIKPELIRQHPLAANRKIVLIVPGGIPTAMDTRHWPVSEDFFYITTWRAEKHRDDIIDIADSGFAFVDVLASCDVVVTKVGYGMFAESMCNRVPMLYVRRHDWPEEPPLVDWAESFGKVHEITREQFFAGQYAADISALEKKTWRRPAPKAGGEREACRAIVELVS
ncbi:MAG: hypothetical protein OEZ43_16880 [Gammaproteobacteria bacterium]|nr:hypothetical protein [Gammaproteobacteria bacterium]